jgi:hypothetical protein
MTRLDNSLGKLPPSLSLRGRNDGRTDTKDEDWGYRRPGRKQLLCAWFIVLTVATLFRLTDRLFPNSSHFAHPTTFARMAEFQEISDIEPWERGVPRQGTMIVPGSSNTVLASRTDQ